MIYPSTYDIVVLQNSTYRMQLTVTQSGGTPINLSGYTIDADICGATEYQQVATFSTAIINAASGIAEISLSPVTTSGIETGRYLYDVSATQPGGDRYYWLKGNLTVERTCSRN
jgi:hypothetical protein